MALEGLLARRLVNRSVAVCVLLAVDSRTSLLDYGNRVIIPSAGVVAIVKYYDIEIHGYRHVPLTSWLRFTNSRRERAIRRVTQRQP